MSNNPVTGGPSRAATALDESLTQLIEHSQALRLDVQAAENARRRTGRLILAAVGLLAVFVALLLMLSWQINKTNDKMADCTTPGGRCYEESRQRTGNAIGDIIRANIFMAQCSRLYPGEVGPAYDRKLETCVTERLAAVTKGRQQATPTP